MVHRWVVVQNYKYPIIMNYLDGTEISAGDIIWWDEGVCLGLVTHILEQKKALEDMGLENPGVCVAFNICENDYTKWGLFLEHGDFEDEGIEKCSSELLSQIHDCGDRLNENIIFKEISSQSYGVNRWQIPDLKGYVWVYSYTANCIICNRVVIDSDFRRVAIISDEYFIVLKETNQLPPKLNWIDLD